MLPKIKRKYINAEVQEYFRDNYLKVSGDLVYIIIDINNEPFKDNYSSLENNIIEDKLHKPKAVSCFVNGAQKPNRKNMVLKTELVHIGVHVYEIVIGVLPSIILYLDAKFMRINLIGNISKKYSFEMDGVENRIKNITDIHIEIH